MDIKRSERFAELDAVVESMNREAAETPGMPYIRIEEYVHYCHARTFLEAFTRKLRPDAAVFSGWLDFVYRDTLEMKSRIGCLDLYTFTYVYLRRMTFRTGNLDTPDDCTEILDMVRFQPYMEARLKAWRGQALTDKENDVLEKHFLDVLNAMKKFLPLSFAG